MIIYRNTRWNRRIHAMFVIFGQHFEKKLRPTFVSNFFDLSRPLFVWALFENWNLHHEEFLQHLDMHMFLKRREQMQFDSAEFWGFSILKIGFVKGSWVLEF